MLSTMLGRLFTWGETHGVDITQSTQTITIDDVRLEAKVEEEGLRLVGTSAKSSKPYWDLQLSEGIAFVMGSEKEGLGEFWKERITEWTCIPMVGGASSLTRTGISNG